MIIARAVMRSWQFWGMTLRLWIAEMKEARYAQEAGFYRLNGIGSSPKRRHSMLTGDLVLGGAWRATHAVPEGMTAMLE